VAASEEYSLDEVVVTAQRRSERLQEVPIAISAFGADDLAKLQITDLSNLRGAVPGLTITNTAGINASNLLTLRGVGGLPLLIGAGQATGVYLDGVYLARSDAAFFSLDDVERIEVLRGPQGTLYGRNATAGAVNIITRDPGDKLQAGVDASYGNYGASKIKGSISGPLAGGFSAGLSASYEDSDGHLRNTVTGDIVDMRRAYTVRGKLRFVGADGAFTATLSTDTGHIDAREAFKTGYVGTTYVGVGIPDQVTMTARQQELTGLHTRSDGTALTINYKVSEELNLTSNSSYRKLDISDAYNFSPIPALQSFAVGHNSTWDQELRALFSRDRFRATVGGNYYADKQNEALQTAPVPATGPLNIVTPNRTISDIKSWALFGQFEYDFNDRLTGVAGVRYTNEHRDWTIDTRIGAPPGPIATGTIMDDAVTPTVGLNFKFRPDVLMYIKASEGYQAPGFNSGANGTVLADLLSRGQPLTFSAENLWAYEAGVKSQFMDRRVTLNVSAFYYDYKHLQVRSSIPPPPSGGIGAVIINNAANSKIKGIEAMLEARITEHWTIGGQATLLDATYSEFCQGVSAGTPQGSNPSCTLPNGNTALAAERAGNKLNQAPDTSGGLMLDYKRPWLGAGTISANLKYSWESNSYYTSTNELGARSGGWTRVDARIGFQTKHGVELYAYGRNLGDKHYVSWVTRVTPTATLVSLSDPRTYGVGLRYKL
jgi:iron complex outermembrane receptor protein